MSTEVKLPNLGDGVAEGDVLEVFVKEGDVIAKDQGIIELETGKATVQVPSSHAGKILKVHVKSGQTIPSGALLLTLEAAAAGASPSSGGSKPAAEKPAAQKTAAPKPPAAKPEAPKAPAPPPAEKPAASPAPTPNAPQPAPAPARQPPAPAPARGSAVVLNEPPAVPGGEIAAGPAIRRFAREVGVDLSRVTGTGEGGRITREDVLAVVRSHSQAPAADGKAKTSTATHHDQWGPVRIERVTKIRKTIAAKMHESWSTVPRVTNFDDADVTELEKIRASSKEDYAKKGIKLTSLPFVIKAVANSLKNHPVINASLDLASDQILYKEYINIGIAVDTERGLVVPSLRGTDEMSIPDIARALAQIVDNVRDGQFTPADLQGSTFSISNLGAIGGTYSTPIINTPEVAILLVGRSRKLPVVVDDQIVPRLMMPLSLSYDHRLVDGAVAARFLNDVIDYLESPSRMLLAP
ncbi:MAG TPA: 2-oxo acid dehydrogenase subunit E2 [Pirellulaceae bacterium]|nr:2-oxo acid dehydrogenase subunit E2 [Pirellulaceae bacterium]